MTEPQRHAQKRGLRQAHNQSKAGLVFMGGRLLLG